MEIAESEKLERARLACPFVCLCLVSVCQSLLLIDSSISSREVGSGKVKWKWRLILLTTVSRAQNLEQTMQMVPSPVFCEEVLDHLDRTF